MQSFNKFLLQLLFRWNHLNIPNAAEQGLSVAISLQTSRNQRGRKDTSARYATAWLDPGVEPNDKGYEYTIPSEKASNLYSGQWQSVSFTRL